jgi:hypothetical protein
MELPVICSTALSGFPQTIYGKGFIGRRIGSANLVTAEAKTAARTETITESLDRRPAVG